MPKYPSIQMYPGDWKKDPALRSCSIAARGLWWEMLQSMFECPERGILKTGTKPWGIPEIATDAGIHINSCANLLEELEMNGVLSRRESDGAIFSRRMVRDEESRKANAQRQEDWRGRNKSSNAGVTPLVTPMLHPSSSSVSNTNHKVKSRPPAPENRATARGSPPALLRTEEEQRQIVKAKDLRIEKEAEALAESRIGAGPPGGGMPLNPTYIDFVKLRDSGNIPRGTNWNDWKSLSAEQRDELMKKPGPASVQLGLDLAKQVAG